MRFKLPPGGDVPPVTAARRVGCRFDAFREALRGFPQADETTGNFDLDAIDAWRRTRNLHLFPDRLDRSENAPSSPVAASDANELICQKIMAGLTPAKNP